MFFLAYGKCSCPDCNEVTLYLIEADTIDEATKKWKAQDKGIRFFPDPSEFMQFFPLEGNTFRTLPFVLEQEQN